MPASREVTGKAHAVFPRWKVLAIVATALLVCSFAFELLPRERPWTRWPKWAQRHIVLGLDLQGGSHILLEVDSRRGSQGEGRRRCGTTCAACVRDDQARLHRPSSVRGNTVEVRVRSGAACQAALPKLSASCRSRSAACCSATGQRTVDVVDAGGGLFR